MDENHSDENEAMFLSEVGVLLELYLKKYLRKMVFCLS